MKFQKKKTHTAVNEKRKTEKNGLCFITYSFIKSFKRIIIFFISQAHSQRNFCYLLSGRHKKYQNRKLGIANSSECQIAVFISEITSVVY